MLLKLKEAAIRDALVTQWLHQSSGRVVEEVKIEGGTARIDVAAFGDELEGFEIKSDYDNFDRLSNQIHAYNRVFRKITLVCGERHLAYAEAILPSWWGILQAVLIDDKIEFRPIRAPRSHDRQRPFSMASLLGKQQAIDLLKAHHCIVPPRLDRRQMWSIMAERVPLRTIERALLKAQKPASSQNIARSLFDTA